MELIEEEGMGPVNLGHQIMERSVHQPHPQNSAMEDLNQEQLLIIKKFLTDMQFEQGNDLTQIHLRPVFQSPWYLGPTIIFYAALVAVGIIVNCVIGGVICKRKLYLTDNIHMCVLNLTISFFCQLFVVIPLSLFAIVVHNWVLGSFICYTLPIIQVRKLPFFKKGTYLCKQAVSILIWVFEK